MNLFFESWTILPLETRLGVASEFNSDSESESLANSGSGMLNLWWGESILCENENWVAMPLGLMWVNVPLSINLKAHLVCRTYGMWLRMHLSASDWGVHDMWASRLAWWVKHPERQSMKKSLHRVFPVTLFRACTLMSGAWLEPLTIRIPSSAVTKTILSSESASANTYRSCQEFLFLCV